MRALTLPVLLVATALAGEPPSRFARPVLPGAPGANRLVVDATLLTGARPLRVDAAGRHVGGLDDLRLTRSDGSELPYLVLAPSGSGRQWRGGAVQAIVPDENASGFEIDLGEVVTVDRLRLTGLPPPVLKRLRLEGSGDRQRWIGLVEETSVFDLPDERLRRLEVGFAAAPVRFVRLTWDDRATAPVALPAGVALRIAEVASPPPAFIPVAVERRASEPGTSRFRILLPGPGLPIRAFELDCAGDHLLRSARVQEPALAGDAVTPRELGTGMLRRVSRDGVTASDLRIAVTTPREVQVELVVDDGDNPPLELRGARAELPALPTLYFESPDGAPLTAKFGASDLAAPRYDLEAARASAEGVVAATAAWGDRIALAPPSAAADEGPPAAMPTAGATIDLGAFRWVRAIPPGPEGLTALRLDAAALAHSTGLADVRLVDSAGRQIPYVVEHVGEPLVLTLPAPVSAPSPAEAGRSRGTTHRVELPYRRLPDARLVLETSERVFERRIVVRAERPPDGRLSTDPVRRLHAAAWRHADLERPAPALTVPLPPLDGTTVWIDVDDGDNRPLRIVAVRVLLPTRRLRFLRANGMDPVLAYGAAGLAAPRYDLTLLAPRILGAPAHEIDAVPETAPSAGSPEEPGAAGDRAGRRIFWTVLAVAVLVLVGVLGRLLRVEGRAGVA
jgi:hypothetical protein